jgi:hypothetical protein
MEWEPIRRTKAEVTELVHDQATIAVRLTESPSAQWAARFNHPEGVSISVGRRPPQLEGNVVRLIVAEREAEDALHELDERIAAANKAYAEHILPALERTKAEELGKTTEAQQRLEALQTRLDKDEPPA